MAATRRSRTTSLLRDAKMRSRTAVSPTPLGPGRYTASKRFFHQPPLLPEITAKEDDLTSESDLTSISSYLDALEAEVEPGLHAEQTAEDGSRSCHILSPKVAVNEDQPAESPLPLEVTTFDDRPVPAIGGKQSDANPGPAISKVSYGSSLMPRASASTTTTRSGQRPVRHVRFIGGEKPENPIIIEVPSFCTFPGAVPAHIT